MLDDGDDVTAAAAVVAERRADLAARGLAARVAAYTTSAPGLEAASLAAHHAADLLLVEAPEAALATGKLDQELTVMLERASCDVAVLAGPPPATAGPIVTPFSGVEHDWSAIEIAAWLARSLRTTLRLLGTEADAAGGRRDASRLLARASLLVQQVIGIATEPVLVRRGEEGVLDAAGDARVLVVGLSDRWRSEGIGATRAALAARAAAPTLFVRRGPRPSGVAPSETLTRFTWTLASHARAQD